MGMGTKRSGRDMEIQISRRGFSTWRSGRGMVHREVEGYGYTEMEGVLVHRKVEGVLVHREIEEVWAHREVE